jgi:hypothetical protein
LAIPPGEELKPVPELTTAPAEPAETQKEEDKSAPSAEKPREDKAEPETSLAEEHDDFEIPGLTGLCFEKPLAIVY